MAQSPEWSCRTISLNVVRGSTIHVELGNAASLYRVSLPGCLELITLRQRTLPEGVEVLLLSLDHCSQNRAEKLLRIAFMPVLPMVLPIVMDNQGQSVFSSAIKGCFIWFQSGRPCATARFTPRKRGQNRQIGAVTPRFLNHPPVGLSRAVSRLARARLPPSRPSRAGNFRCFGSCFIMRSCSCVWRWWLGCPRSALLPSADAGY